MRDSPWDEHQLVLQEFVATDHGQTVLAAVARALGESPAELTARMAELPLLDLYVPFRRHRQTWRGTTGVIVLATLNDEGGTVRAYDADGDMQPPVTAGSVPDYPVMALHPAEPKARRVGRQPTGQGDVIESAGDGQAVPRFTWIEPDGDVISGKVADIVAGRDPRFRIITMAGGETTDLDHIRIYFCDGAGTSGDVELRVEVTFINADGTVNGTGLYDNYSFAEPDKCDWEHFTEEFPGVPLIARATPDSSTHKIVIEVSEDDCDCFGNDDDYYGSRDFFWDDRDEDRSIHEGGHQTTVIRLDWSPLSPSVLTSVWVPATFTREDVDALVTVQARDQYGYGLSGYSVSNWSIDDTSIASVSSIGARKAVISGISAGSTSLHATISGITDAGSVTVDPGTGCPPPQIICE